MARPLSTRINEAVETFIAGTLEKSGPAKRATVTFILNATRKHIMGIVDASLKGDQGIGALDTICRALDSTSSTYDASILARAGLENLDKEILAYRQEIKWKVLSDMIREILPEDESSFTPDTIRASDTALHEALKDAVLYGKSGKKVEWETLKEYLPGDLAKRFETRNLTREERRRQSTDEKAERKRRIEEDSKTLIEDLNLIDVIAGLGKDPKKLSYYLQLTGQFTEEQVNRIVYVSFTGLREGQTENKLERIMFEYQNALTPIEILSEVPYETSENSVTMKVRVPEGATRLLVRGPWKRDIKINGEKEIEFSVILEAGEPNEVQLVAYNDETKTRSELSTSTIEQTSDVDDKSTIVDFLRSLTAQMLDDIESDENKKKLFNECLEESCIRHFAGDFAVGKAYVESIIKQQKNALIKKALRRIVSLFEEINEVEMPFLQEGEDLMFFQKYCVYKMEQKRMNGEKGVILANEPGLGKTLNALAFGHNHEMTVVTPNSAASTWTEQEARFFKSPFLVSLAGRAKARRMKLLKDRKQKSGVVTNVEFVRVKEGDGAAEEGGKIQLLNERRFPDREKLLVVDEAHFLKNESQQTEGIGLLEADFILLLTASPYRTSAALAKVMHKIFPNDERFLNIAAFEEAFPMNDPASLKALHILVRPHIVRFLKDEVMPTYDKDKPLEEQPLSLPKKRYINPFETGIGQFTLTRAQEMAMLEMFQDWQAWNQKYDASMPRGKKAKLDGVRASDDRMSKENAMRMLVNNPAHINSAEASPKHAEAMRIIDKEIGDGGKVIVFCRYRLEIEVYKKILAERGIDFAEYSGDVTEEGFKKDKSGKELTFAVDNFGNYIFDNNGVPRQTTDTEKGRSMLAADYERLTFQNSPGKKVMLATFGAGSQSVTFTAGNAMIFDDMPRDYIEQYQAEDRNHRIDEKRPKYEVRYYNLVAKHSEEFLEYTREVMIDDELSAHDAWFAQGTMDSVQYANLKAQKISFELLNNGIAAEPDLIEPERPYSMDGYSQAM